MFKEFTEWGKYHWGWQNSWPGKAHEYEGDGKQVHMVIGNRDKVYPADVDNGLYYSGDTSSWESGSLCKIVGNNNVIQIDINQDILMDGNYFSGKWHGRNLVPIYVDGKYNVIILNVNKKIHIFMRTYRAHSHQLAVTSSPDNCFIVKGLNRITSNIKFQNRIASTVSLGHDNGMQGWPNP